MPKHPSSSSSPSSSSAPPSKKQKISGKTTSLSPYDTHIINYVNMNYAPKWIADLLVKKHKSPVFFTTPSLKTN
jgi:ABC-type uncharacterized transport system substrate-binding protein